MTFPTIHLNGTSKERLVEDLCDACNAIDAAYEALKKTAPNGRDYYPQGPEALERATGEHMLRLRKLDAIKGELEQIVLYIERQ